MDNILTILTSEDKSEVKEAFKEILIENIRKDFDERRFYLFDEEPIQEMIDEAIEEVKSEIKPLLKDYMMKQMQDKLGI